MNGIVGGSRQGRGSGSGGSAGDWWSLGHGSSGLGGSGAKALDRLRAVEQDHGRGSGGNVNGNEVGASLL